MNRLLCSSAIRRQVPQVASLYMKGTASRLPSMAQKLAPQPTNRCFSALADILKREHTEEIDNNTTEMPPDLSDVKTALEQEEGWKIVDDGALTKLYRTLSNGSKVQIAFHCQDTVEDVEGCIEDDGYAGDEAAVPIRFHVAVTKAGKTLAMTCLTTEDLSASIQSVAVTGQLQDDYLVAASDYQGPEFVELAEDLQESFHDFLLDDIGVSENVVSFLSMYCDFKEQTEYVKFLSEARNLVK